MYTTTALPGTRRTRICRRPDAARRITHHKWPRTPPLRRVARIGENARRSGRKPITQRQQRQVAEFPADYL
jgi:hypothetical protein